MTERIFALVLMAICNSETDCFFQGDILWLKHFPNFYPRFWICFLLYYLTPLLVSLCKMEQRKEERNNQASFIRGSNDSAEFCVWIVWYHAERRSSLHSLLQRTDPDQRKVLIAKVILCIYINRYEQRSNTRTSSKKPKKHSPVASVLTAFLVRSARIFSFIP